MPFDKTRAQKIIGRSRSEYQCNHVVNYVLFGNKNGHLADYYLRYGVQTHKTSAGVVAVGNDGQHVGIFINENEFMHSSSRQYKVITVDKTQLKYIFPQGFQLRT